MTLPGVIPFPQEFVKQYYRNRWWIGITLGEMLDRSCDLYFYKDSLVTEKVRLTYRELQKRVNQGAIAFLHLGIQKQDRVLLQIPNWAEFVYAYYGLHKIGAIPVMCIPRFSQREMEHFCKLIEAKAWIVARRFEKIDYLPIIQGIQTQPFSPKHILIIESEENESSLPEGTQSFNKLLEGVDLSQYPKDYLSSFRPDPGDICHLIPTGGSTGLPKLVPRTHNDFFCNFYFRARVWERSPRDITLIATPITHNMANEVSLNPTLLYGGKIVMISSTRSKEILEAIEKERVTNTILVVPQLQQIIDDPDLKQYDLSSLRVIAGAGSHVPSELIKKIYERIGCKFYNVFGMSEGPCAQTRWDDPEEVVLHTVGWPICPYDEFKVIDSKGNELPLTRV